MFDSTVKMRNQVVVEHLTSNDDGLRKEAQDTLNDYIRVKAREDSIVRAILPPLTVTAADLDPQINVEEPTILFEKEPDTPNAVTVPFGAGVEAHEIEGEKFLVAFNTIKTPKKRKSKFLLMNYRNDIRNILTDLDIKEILEHEDRRFFSTIDSWLVAAGTSITSAGSVALWQNVAGGLTPETWVDMMQIMPKAHARFVPATVVMNMVRAEEFFSWNADEVGDEVKKDVLANGWTLKKVDGRNIIVTIKRDIVGDNDVYMFAEPDKLGKFCILQDATIYPKAEGEMLEWYCLEAIGLTLAQITGVAKATLTG